MLILSKPSDFATYRDQKLGHSDWFTIEQSHISQFAALTGDDFWIHVDESRALKEKPEGKTIAHGLFVLSLIPLLQRQIFKIEKRGKGINYGSNKVRYFEPVPVGSRIRLHQSLAAVEVGERSTKITSLNTFELQGALRLAVVADFILLLYESEV